MKTIAVLGLGKMGHGIASCLLRAGHNVIVWNRSYEKANDLINRGVIWAATPAEAAANASIVFSMVADDIASEAVWLGAIGALHAMKPGSFIVECSTLSAKHVARLAAAAEEKQLRYIDCPVTGMPEAAEKAALTLLVGAVPADLELVRPVLSSISNTIRYFGSVGTGTAYKLIINLMGAVQIAALAEGIAMAMRVGLDREAVINAIENSAAASPQVIRHTRKMAALNFDADPLFTTSLRYKDARYALELATTLSVKIPLGEVATECFKQASIDGPALDEATVIEQFLKKT